MTAKNGDISEPWETPGRTAVVILGMHRSGTSALAGALTHLGCAGPATPIAARDDNPKGFFESLEVVTLNDAILAQGRSAWHDWAAFDSSRFSAEHAAAFRADASSVLVREFGAAPMIVLKDPRICRLLPLWSEALREDGRTAVFAHIIRDPREVARSLRTRNEIDLAYGLLLWLRHVLDAEADSRGQARVFVTHSGLLRNWQKTIARMERILKVEFPVRPADAAPEIDSFLSRDLHRNRVSGDVPDGRCEIPAWVVAVQAILDGWAAGIERMEDYAALDSLRDQLNGAETMFLPVVGNVLQARKDLASAEAEASAEKQRANSCSQQVRNLSLELEAANRRVEAGRGKLKEKLARIAALEDGLRKRGRDLERLAAALRGAERQVGELSRDLAQKEDENAELRLSFSWRVTAPIRWVGTGLRKAGWRRGQ